MMARGVDACPMEKLAVRGYVEVLKHCREILGIRNALARRLLETAPDLFIGVDAPDFNLGLEAKLKAAGIRTVHYVSPSIWAWRAERIHTIGRSVTACWCCSRSRPIYASAGIPVSYVGHPLADAMPLEPDRAGARAQLRLAEDGAGAWRCCPAAACRARAARDLLIDTAALLHAAPGAALLRPARHARDARLLRGAARCATRRACRSSCSSATRAWRCPPATSRWSRAAPPPWRPRCASCPMVITYRCTRSTRWRMKSKRLLPYVGLPNILAGEFVVPELLQDDATPRSAGAGATGSTTRRREAAARALRSDCTSLRAATRSAQAAAAIAQVVQPNRSRCIRRQRFAPLRG